MTPSRSKGAERYAEIQKRERGIKQELDNATKLRSIGEGGQAAAAAFGEKPKIQQKKQAAQDKAAGKSAFKRAPSW